MDNSQARRDAPTTQTVLLDAEAGSHRHAQVVLQLAGPLLCAAGIAQLVRTNGAGAAGAGLMVLAGVAVVIAAARYSIGWDVSYKGHHVRFENHSWLAERLFIDGRLVDRGGLGMTMTLRGTIEAGEGAENRITATSRAGFTEFSCRIVAESFETHAT